MSDSSTIDAGELDNNDYLDEDLTATVNIGTVTSGKKYPKGTKIETILRDILIKEEPPSVTINLNPSATLYDVVNDTVSEVVITGVVVKKTYNPTLITFYVNNTVVHEKAISDGGNVSYSYKPATPTNQDMIIKVVVSDGKLQGTATKNIKFVGKSYYGVIDASVGTPSEAQVKALANNTLKDVKGLTYSHITIDYGKVVYAYPQSFGALTSIKDTINNINYNDSFSRTAFKVDGIDYYVYTQTDPSASDDVQIVFA